MNLPPGPRIPFTIEAGDPVVITVTYKGQRYKLRLQTSVLGVIVAPGEGGGPGIPNFAIQSGNVMLIEKDTGS